MRQIDAMVFDIQDVGTRFYTYVWNMIMAMEFAAEMRRTFVVFDRPDPIGGELVQGPLRERRDIVGLYPVTVRYGMTVGELARWVNSEFKIGADLRVIPMQGWRRSMNYADTKMPWIAPSPNMPSYESALHYPGICLFEGTNLSVGRGTPIAFQHIGAPWLNAQELVTRLNTKNLPGVRFEVEKFTPVNAGDQKYTNVAVNGVKLTATDAARYNPVVTSMHILVELQKLHGDSLRFNVAHFDRLIGSKRVREQIVAGAPVTQITKDWNDQVESFNRTRVKYLLYR
jgi:beta-N-acetylhexosaminidase